MECALIKKGFDDIYIIKEESKIKINKKENIMSSKLSTIRHFINDLKKYKISYHEIASFKHSSGKQVHVVRARINSKIAGHLFETYKNPDNRNLSAEGCNVLVRDLQNGQWQENCEPITINAESEIANGQHRLRALSLVDGEHWIMFHIGLPKEVTTFDSGIPRTFWHYLNMRESHLKKYSYLITGLTYLDLNNAQFAGKFSHSEKFEIGEKYAKELDDIAHLFKKKKGRGYILVPFCAAMIFASKTKPQGVKKFATRIISVLDGEEGAKEGSPERWIVKYLKGFDPKLKDCKKINGASARREMALYGLYALKSFLEDKKIYREPKDDTLTDIYLYWTGQTVKPIQNRKSQNKSKSKKAA